MSEEKNWYYLSETNEQLGPVSEARIRELIVSGTLNRLTRVWKPGFENWIELENTSFNRFLNKKSAGSDPDVQKQKKTPVGLWIALAVSLTVILAMGALIAFMFLHPAKTQKEGPGTDSPEAAAKAFAEAYGAKDIDSLYTACALESYVEHYDLEKNIERMQCLTPVMMYLYGKSEGTAALNERIREMNLTKSFYYLYETPIWSHRDDQERRSMAIKLGEMEMEELTGLVKGVDELGSVMVNDVESVSEFCKETEQDALMKSFSADGVKKQQAELEKVYGGEIEDLVVSMDIDGDHYYLCLQTISYDGDRWYVLNTHGTLASMLGLSIDSGGLVPAPDL